MKAVYDAGVLLAADRNDRRVWADHRLRLSAGVVPKTTAPVVAQVSRSRRQVQLRRFLRGCEVVAFSAADAHGTGALLARASLTDVVDAHLVDVARRTQSMVLTSDVEDIRRLSSQLPAPIEVRPVGM